MDRLILSRRSGKNVLKPGLRASSPHRWRLASRRGQTPGPGFTRSSRQVSSAASPVGVTLPARFGGNQPARPAFAAAYRRALDRSWNALQQESRGETIVTDQSRERGDEGRTRLGRREPSDSRRRE
jgi:hypothetical protein